MVQGFGFRVWGSGFSDFGSDLLTASAEPTAKLVCLPLAHPLRSQSSLARAVCQNLELGTV